MQYSDITKYRLANQNITRIDSTKSPKEVISSLGAIQAQDYQASLWAIGLRCKDGTTKKDVEAAITKRKIARTWLMRGTLHFAASSDIHWMLKLFAPRLLNTAIMRDRHLGLNDNVVNKTKTLFYNALKGGNQLTRDEMYKILDSAGMIPSKNNLGYHMLYRAAWDGLICFGPPSGKDQTFVLLEEYVKESDELSNEQANAELAYRYFSSHGPATIKDYVWWSGLKVSDARIGIQENAARLVEEMIDEKVYYMPKNMPRIEDRGSRVHLLPAFDEYVVSYADRSAMFGNEKIRKMLRFGKISFAHSNGIFLPVIVINGAIVGTWKKKVVKDNVVLTIQQFTKFSKKDMEGVRDEMERYGSFLGVNVVLK